MPPRTPVLLAALLAAAGSFAAPPRPPASPAPARPRAVVVGWDGADWRLLDALLAEGRLPNLAALIGEGRSARLETFRPRASPILWTTAVTGVGPLEHGVADFQEWDTLAGALVPISGRSRRGPALWNVASARGLQVGVVGWWATWPAEAVNGFFVSDRASPVLFDAATLSRSPALTWPEELADGIRLLGRREGQPPYEEVARFLDVSRKEFDAAVARDDDLKDPITGVRKILGSTRVYARTAIDLYDRRKPDLLLVYFEGPDEIGHVIGRYHPPLLPGVDAEGFAKYSRGVALYYQEVDRILGELARRARADGATVVLLSDHGFKWGPDRPVSFSSIDVQTAYLWHDPEGILVAAGPGIAPAAARGVASIFDVAPILCRLLGLPPDPRMKGKVPAGFLSARAPRALPPVPWRTTFPVKRARPVRDLAAERKAGEEFTKKLISLGYLTGTGGAAAEQAADDTGEVRMTAHAVSNLGVYLAEQGKEAESLVYFDRAIAADPANASFRDNKADALERLGRFEEADREAVKACNLAGEGGTDRLMARVVRRVELGKTPAAVALLERALAEVAPPRPPFLDSLGRLYFDQRRCSDARPLFEKLTATTPDDPGAWVMLARCRRCLGDAPGAREAYRRALALAPSDERIRREASAPR